MAASTRWRLLGKGQPCCVYESDPRVHSGRQIVLQCTNLYKFMTTRMHTCETMASYRVLTKIVFLPLVCWSFSKNDNEKEYRTWKQPLFIYYETAYWPKVHYSTGNYHNCVINVKQLEYMYVHSCWPWRPPGERAWNTFQLCGECELLHRSPVESRIQMLCFIPHKLPRRSYVATLRNTRMRYVTRCHIFFTQQSLPL